MNGNRFHLPQLSRRSLLGGVAAGGLALGAGLAGCSSTPDTNPDSSSAPQQTSGGKTKVRISSWMQFEPGRQEAWEKVTSRFNEENTNIEVEIIGWPFTEYSNQVLTQVQAGAFEADLVTAPPDLASRLFSLGVLGSLNDAIAEADVAPDPNLHAFMMDGSDFFGVSVVTVNFGLLYNEAVFDQAGITPASNVDEWVQQAIDLTERPDMFGLIAANTMAEAGNWWFQLQNWVNAYDGVWAQGNKPMVTSDPVIKTLELYQRMYDGAIPQGSNDAQLMELMSSGRAAQALLVSPTVNVLRASNEEVYADLRSTAAPWASGKGTARVHPISLYEGSSNKDAANEFLAWLLRPENMGELLMESLDVLSPYPELGEDPAFQEYVSDLPWVDGYMAIDPVTPMDLMGDFINASDEFGNIVLSNFEKSLTQGLPVAEAMGSAQAELEALAGRLG